MAIAPGSTGPKQKTQEKAVRRSAWRTWLLEPLLWIAFFLGSIFFAIYGVTLLLRMSFADVWVAGFVYTVLMPAFVLSPGRRMRGYNPFGTVVRRSAPRLLTLHLLCLAVFMSMVALHESASPWVAILHAFSAHHPDFADAFFIGAPLALVLAQGVRSYSILENTRQQLEQAQQPSL